MVQARTSGTTVGVTPRRRRLLTALGVVVAVLLAATVADALVAARAEHRISERIYRDAHLASPPAVEVTGFPYLGAVLSHEVPSVSVQANDVDVPGFGLVSVTSSAQKVTLPTDAVVSGSFTDAPARKVFTSLRLDGVAVGRRMGVDDLLIQAKDDISPQGGWETEAVFEGTPRGFSEPAAVEMRLRIREGNVHIVPTRVIRAPRDTGPRAPSVDGADLDPALTRQIMDTFRLDIPGSSFPLRSRPSRIYTSGGSVTVETEQLYTRVSVSDLAPRGRDLTEDETPGL